MPPLWPTKASPGFDSAPKRRASVANSMCSIMPSTLLVTPRQFGPTMARPPSRAISAISSCICSSPTSAKPAANTMAEPTLRFTHAATASRTPAAGNVKTARSTPSGNSSGLLRTGRPSIGSALRPTRWMSPLKSFNSSDCRMTWPALPARADIPMMANDRGRRNLATAFGPRATSGPFISRPCRAGT